MRVVFAAGRLLFALLICQGWIGALAVVGWTQTWMRRRVERSCGLRDQAPFPAWIYEYNDPIRIHFFTHLKLGLKVLLSQMAVTGIPMLMLLFAWHTGWTHSFNKEYELSWLGAATGFTSMILFSLTMLYVPIATVRVAITGQMKSFFALGTIRAIARRSAGTQVIVAGLTTLFTIPLSLLWVVPMFFGQVATTDGSFNVWLESIGNLPDAELLAFLKSYYLWGSAVMLVAWLILAMVMAKSYVRGLTSLAADPNFESSQLNDAERALVANAKLPEAAGCLSRLSRPACAVITFALWMTLPMQTIVREFLNFHPLRGFSSYHLIHLPWLNNIPTALKERVKIENEATQTTRADDPA